MSAVGSTITATGPTTFSGLTIAATPTSQAQYNTSFSVAGVLTVNGGITFAPTGGTITMSAVGSTITATGPTTFSGLTIAATPTSQAQYNTSFSVAGVLTVSGGITFAPTGGTITFNSGASISNLGTLTFNNLTIANSASVSSSSNFNIAGNYTNSGSFALSNNTVTFNATSGTKTINSTGATNDDFYNIIFNDGGGPATFQLESTLDVNNDLTITGGTLDTKSGGDNTIYVGGNWDNNDTFTARSGKVYFDAASGSKTIYDNQSPFYDLEFTSSGGADWTYFDEGTASGSATHSTTVQSGTATFVNARTGTVTFNGGALNVDWYLGIHAVNLIDNNTDINTGDNDITVSENSGTPQSTVFKYSGGWSGATSQNTDTDSSGKNPQPNNTGAIRIREYNRTISATTLYNYNLHINWVLQSGTNYGEYDYYDDYGREGGSEYKQYITSCLANTSTCDDDGTNSDDVIGSAWHREAPGSINGSKPYDGLNEPPDSGTWYAGMLTGLSFGIDSFSIGFGEIIPGANPTNDQTNTLTVSTSATNGFTVTAWSTQPMTCSEVGSCGSSEIDDWSAGNDNPTTWSNGSFGFGYSTNDITLAGGTAGRFSGTKFAGFTRIGESKPVADRSNTECPCSNQQNTITYRIAAPQTKTAGPYSTTIVYVCTANY